MKMKMTGCGGLTLTSLSPESLPGIECGGFCFCLYKPNGSWPERLLLGGFWRRQRNCMKCHLHFEPGEPKGFIAGSQEMNDHLKCFEVPPGRTDVVPPNDDEMVESK